MHKRISREHFKQREIDKDYFSKRLGEMENVDILKGSKRKKIFLNN